MCLWVKILNKACVYLPEEPCNHRTMRLPSAQLFPGGNFRLHMRRRYATTRWSENGIKWDKKLPKLFKVSISSSHGKRQISHAWWDENSQWDRNKFCVRQFFLPRLNNLCVWVNEMWVLGKIALKIKRLFPPSLCTARMCAWGKIILFLFYRWGKWQAHFRVLLFLSLLIQSSFIHSNVHALFFIHPHHFYLVCRTKKRGESGEKV